MYKKKEFLKRADFLIKKIETILDEDYEKRTENISDSDLQSMLRLIKHRKMIVEANQLPAKEMRYRSLTRIIIDQWPLVSQLGDEISELEECYINL